MNKIKLAFFIHLLGFLLPFLIPLSLFFLLLESYTYLGFVHKHWLIDSRIVSFISIAALMLIVSRLHRQANKSNFTENLLDFVFKIIVILTPILMITYLMMQTLEAKNYSNYIFSNYHINPDNFAYVVFYSLTISIIYSHKLLLMSATSNISNNILGGKWFRFDNIVIAVTVLIIGYNLVTQAIVVTNRIVKNSVYMITHINLSDYDKLFKLWGDYYGFVHSVSKVVGKAEVVILPPQVSPWLTIGNGGLTRYFISNAEVKHFDFTNQDIIDCNCNYVVVSAGIDGKENWKIFPDVELEYKKMWIYKDKGLHLVSTDDIFNPNEYTGTSMFGFIEL